MRQPEPTTGCFRLIVINLLVLALMLLLVEGFSSCVLIARLIAGTARPAQLAERQHTEYDPELGWVNKPNVDIPDMYGPGIYLRTNGQRFRSNHEVGRVPPAGKQRIICSGDSFTLGYGVDNDHTWCEQLTALDPALETVNMGQGGYGVDQAYLWFKRDAAKLERRMHILAFITSDFHRMQSSRFYGYGKPVLEIDGARLVTRNVPVPARTYGAERATPLLENLRKLRTFSLLERIAARIRPQRSNAARDLETQEVLKKVFADLKSINEAQGSQLVLVYLPTPKELMGDPPRAWLRFVGDEARALDVPFIDAFGAFRRLPVEAVEGLFIAEGEIDFPGAAGHLNDQGNALAARVIYDGVKSLLAPPAESSPGRRSTPGRASSRRETGGSRTGRFAFSGASTVGPRPTMLRSWGPPR